MGSEMCIRDRYTSRQPPTPPQQQYTAAPTSTQPYTPAYTYMQQYPPVQPRESREIEMLKSQIMEVSRKVTELAQMIGKKGEELVEIRVPVRTQDGRIVLGPDNNPITVPMKVPATMVPLVMSMVNPQQPQKTAAEEVKEEIEKVRETYEKRLEKLEEELKKKEEQYRKEREELEKKLHEKELEMEKEERRRLEERLKELEKEYKSEREVLLKEMAELRKTIQRLPAGEYETEIGRLGDKALTIISERKPIERIVEVLKPPEKKVSSKGLLGRLPEEFVSYE